MASNRTGATDHTETYKTLRDAVLNPTTRTAARAHPTAGPLLKNLSDADLDSLATVARGQADCTCTQQP
jgi:hypothetical protein